jgi:hypothetical protein
VGSLPRLAFMPNVACPYLRLMGLGCGTILRGLCVGFAQTCSTLHPGSWKTCGAELETMRTAANEWGSQCFTPCSVECCSGGVGLRPFWRLSTQRKRSGAKLANCFEGDLCRVKARALLIERAPDARLKAQPLLEQALAVARSQNARSIELLVARDLADLFEPARRAHPGPRSPRPHLRLVHRGLRNRRSEGDEGSPGRVLLSRILTDIPAQGVSQTCNGQLLFA